MGLVSQKLQITWDLLRIKKKKQTCVSGRSLGKSKIATANISLKMDLK